MHNTSHRVCHVTLSTSMCVLTQMHACVLTHTAHHRGIPSSRYRWYRVTYRLSTVACIHYRGCTYHRWSSPSGRAMPSSSGCVICIWVSRASVHVRVRRTRAQRYLTYTQEQYSDCLARPRTRTRVHAHATIPNVHPQPALYPEPLLA